MTTALKVANDIVKWYIPDCVKGTDRTGRVKIIAERIEAHDKAEKQRLTDELEKFKCANQDCPAVKLLEKK